MDTTPAQYNRQTTRLLKRVLSTFVILQLIFTGWVATSHMAVASHGHQQHGHIHFDSHQANFVHDHKAHSHFHDNDSQTEHCCEVHIPLSYLAAHGLSFTNQVIHTSPITALLSPMTTRHLKPLLPPPNH